MSATYTVTKLVYKGQKDNPHGGVLHKFYCTFNEEDGTEHEDVYWQRKSQELPIGQEVYGHIEDGEYGPRFKTDQRPDGSGNQGSSGGTFNASRYQKEGMTKDEFWDAKNERDVESQARMGRAHAQEMSLRWAAIVTDGPMEVNLNVVKDWTDWFHQDVQRFPLDADLGGGNGTDAPLAPAADVSAEPFAAGGTVPTGLPEASPQQKARLTKEFTKAGLSRDAMKAVVLYRCRSERATKEGASQLIQDLMDGATHDTLLAEIHDAKRAGDPLASRAAALIPSEVPADTEGLPEVDAVSATPFRQPKVMSGYPLDSEEQAVVDRAANEVVEPNGDKDIPF